VYDSQRMIRKAAKRSTPPEAQEARTPTKPNEGIAELRQIAVDLIDVPKNPARRYLGDISALAESMQEYGLQQPISVRADGQRFSVTSGMRRLAAARLLGWATITVFVRTLSADDAYLVDLVENLQREDLTAEEEADALGELVRTRGWTLQQVADALKRSVAYVSKRVRLFEDPGLREAVTRRNLPISTAEELLAAEPDQRVSLIERALAERWDQAHAREAVRPLELQLPVHLLSSKASDTRGADRNDESSERSRQSPSGGVDARPRGFTRAIRDFHHMILTIRAQDLTTADRSALRSLFRDLVMLGRAPTVATKPVFPELPTPPGPGRQQANRAGSSAKRKTGPPKITRSGRR
jgi:ParB family transcriptional regulator, chromosome partitioning protein